MTRDDYLSVGRNERGDMLFRTWLLHLAGKAVGIQFHVGGWPYGAAYRRSLNGRAFADSSEVGCSSNAGVMS